MAASAPAPSPPDAASTPAAQAAPSTNPAATFSTTAQPTPAVPPTSATSKDAVPAVPGSSNPGATASAAEKPASEAPKPVPAADKSEPPTAPKQEPPKAISLPTPFPTPISPLTSSASPDLVAGPPTLLPPLPVNKALTISHEETSSPAAITASPRQPQRVDTLADLSSHSTNQRSRRNSLAGSPVITPKASATPLPGRSEKAQSASGASAAAPPNLASFNDRPHPVQHPADPLNIVLYAGEEGKAFHVHRHTLTSKVPYFASLFHDARSPPDVQSLTFESLDVHGFGLFIRWVTGGPLHGPTDFDSLTHYIALYAAALHFGVEPLQNETIDLCRAYYRHNNMTAPAYRLEYIYAFTAGPNIMRDFLVSTAAYRSLSGDPGQPGPVLSDSLRGLLSRGGDLAPDFAEALVKLSRNGLEDARRGSDAAWHVGDVGPAEFREP